MQGGDAHGDTSWLRELSGPTRAEHSWVGLSLDQHPSCPLALLTLFLLFSREPIGKKRSGKDSFPLCCFHQLLLPPTFEVSSCGVKSQPHSNPCPVGLPCPVTPPPSPGIPLQPPGPHPTPPEPLWCSPSWGRCPQLSALPWPPPPLLSLPHALSPVLLFSSGIIQRTASFLQRGTNTAPALALLCLSLGGHLLSWGGRELVTLASSCHLPRGFVAWLLVQLHLGQGMCPRSCRGSAGLGVQNFRSAEECLSCLGDRNCSRMFSFTSWELRGRCLGLGGSSREGNASERPPCWCGLGLSELPKKSRREEWKGL